MYYKNFPNLFSEGQIGNVKLRNRVVMAPMGTSHTGPDLRFNQELIEFYVARAKGGVGGGPAGMEAAFIAAKRGHQVTLFEKDTELGGLLNLAEKESFKYHIGYLKNYLIHETKKQGVELRLDEEATVEKIKETNPDSVIVATGADVFVPGIPGSDRENVITVRELDEDALGKNQKIVVLGGGLVGCETALGLAQKGHQVTIVEMLPEVAKDLMLINRISLLTLLPTCGVRICTNTKCKSIEEDKMICTDAEGKEISFEYDLIIAATGTKPVNTLTDSVLDAFPDVQGIGDCVKSSKISNSCQRSNQFLYKYHLLYLSPHQATKASCLLFRNCR